MTLATDSEQAPQDEPGRLAAWAAARAAGLNNRAAAATLGVTEVELVASGCGSFVTRLRPDCSALLARLPELGEIKCIVRNPWAVLERAGVVHSVQPGTSDRLLIQADRFEADCQVGLWRAGFALEEAGAHGSKLSFQFFTADGTSAAKFFLRHAGGSDAFRALVQAFADPDQAAAQTVAPARPTAYMPLERLVAAHYGGLLGFLQTASRAGYPLHLLVRSGAASLTTTKVIERVKRSDQVAWVNVLDDGLDLHLHEKKLRYLRLSRDADANAGWLHWFSERRAVALSVRVGDGWTELTRAAAAIGV